MTMHDFDAEIVNLLNTTPEEYQRLSGPIVIERLYDEQIKQYNNLLNSLYKAAVNREPNSELGITNLKIRRELSEYFKQYVINISSQTDKEQITTEFIINNSIVPILNPNLVLDLIAKIDSKVKFSSDVTIYNQYFDRFVSYMCSELSIRSDAQNINFSLNVKYNIEYTKEYTNIRKKLISTTTKLPSIKRNNDSNTIKLNIDLETLQEKIRDLEDKAIQNMANLQSELQKQTEKIKDNHELTKRLNNVVNEQIQASIDTISNYEKSITEQLKTKQLGVLWDQRARSALISLWITGGVLILMFLLAIIGIPFFKAEISSLIKVDQAEARTETILFALQISRAFLIAVPVILYFWAIKLLIRVFIRSLLLLDDARQRRTIMDTYLHMIKESPVDEKFLPLILWALCRQVPGHGSDGIEPPDFTEVVNAGLKLKNPG